MSAETDRVFCSDEARLEADALVATASRATRWVVLEVRAPWGKRAVEEDPVPEALRRWVDRVRSEVPSARVVFARRPERTEGPKRVFVAAVDEDRQELRSGTVDDWSELTERVPVEGLGDLAVDLPQSSEPLLLVCGNARRDRCCARRGLPVFEAALDSPRSAGVGVWLATHLGGHRYAAVALALPSGVQYGFLGVEDVPDLLTSIDAGEILVERFRGRVFHAPAVQAADLYLRRRLELRDAGAIRFREEGSEPAAGLVRLEAGGATYRIRVAESRHSAIVSCGPRTKEIAAWTLQEIVREEGEA